MILEAGLEDLLDMLQSSVCGQEAKGLWPRKLESVSNVSRRPDLLANN